MVALFIVLGVLSVAAIVATIIALRSDGYGARPTLECYSSRHPV
ncbi:hypothetical protein [Humidisolicoccus flavus]